jgi:lysophospholipase
MAMAPFLFRYISAGDGTRLRVGVFEPEKKSRRVCVLLSGHSEFIEKYMEVTAELNARGLVVVSFDWRGQGGSTRPLANPMKSHVGDFAEYDDDLKSVVEQVVAPFTPATPILLAHSMGGAVGIRALHDRPQMFRAAVFSSPLLEVSARGYPSFVARAAAALQTLTGRGRNFAWGQRRRDPLQDDFSTQLCTSDPERFARTQDFLKSYPALRLGGPTWGWLHAAYRSGRKLKQAGYAEAIQTPVLVVGAGRDRIVKLDATRRFAARLPRGRYVELEESEHEILMERDAIRARFWQEFDGFLDSL